MYSVVASDAFAILSVLLIPFIIFNLAVYWRTSACEQDKYTGKVVLITGASSGIGEHIAYEWARRGACLVLVARREDRLCEVADKARELGAQDTVVVPADVSKVEDCKLFVEKAVQHFDRLDILVNNAGITRRNMFEDIENISGFLPIMDVNFWGSVYATHFAIPHLRRAKGKILVIASAAGWLSLPKSSIYSASKAALISFFETLRLEFGNDIGITIVAPGWVDTDIIPKSKVKYGDWLIMSKEACARAVVNSAINGDRYLTKPFWIRTVLLLKLFCPTMLEYCFSFVNKFKAAATVEGSKVE